MKLIFLNILPILFLTLIAPKTEAQSFLKRKTVAPLTFKEMQVQFDTWRKTVPTSQQKYWKSFKRWEMETQLHTDAKGNPVDASLFVDEITKAANEKAAMSTNRSTLVNTWLPTGPFTQPINQTGYLEVGMGRINCMAFHPTDPATYFVGVAQGGVWKTSNNGQTWTPLTDNLPILRVSDIAIDPITPTTMYISLCDFEYVDVSLQLNGRKRNTHYGLGLYKSIDGGITWQPTSLSFQLTNGDASLLRKTIIHPTLTNKLVTCGVSGMYVSNDAGLNWTKTMDSLFWDLVQDPVNPNMLYAATGWLKNSNTGNAAIYKSTDFGVTWTMLSTGIPPSGAVQRIKLAIAPSDNNYIYALTVDLDRGLYGFYKTTDAGVNWQYIAPTLNILDGGQGLGTGGQGTYDLGLCVSTSNRDELYAAGVNMWGSVDGAQSFNPISHWTTSYGPTTHADVHSIDIQPLTGNIFVCNDGGIYRTSTITIHNWADAISGIPWPTQWAKLNDGLQITAFYRLSSSKNNSAKLLAGAQDNSSYFFNGSYWTNIFGGDGMDNYINPQNDSNIIGSSQFGNFDLSFDNGVNSFWCNPNVNGELAEWTTPLVADYANNGTLYAGYENVSKTVDGGNSWNGISSFPPTGIANNEISALAVSASNSNVIYAAKRVRYEFGTPGSLYNTLDGGTTWNNITLGIPDSLYYTSVEVNSSTSSTAYITMAGFSIGNKIFRTMNNGATWQNISYNLPNLPVNCVKSLPGGKILVAATDIGVYMLEDTASTWVNISNGLPNVIVSDIEVNVPMNRLYISTFGRGIWETDLDVILETKKLSSVVSNFAILPNLNDGNFSVQLPNELSKTLPYKLEVIDIMGRNVYQTILTSNQTQLQTNLSSGKYFIKLSGQSLSHVQSFIVE
jgi:photosystem II stability/assembly factor-like uncharacterized protein